MIVPCPECKGKKKVERKYFTPNPMGGKRIKLKGMIECPTCLGIGEIDNEPKIDPRPVCIKCGGALDVGLTHEVWDYLHSKVITIIVTTICPKCLGEGRLNETET